MKRYTGKIVIELTTNAEDRKEALYNLKDAVQSLISERILDVYIDEDTKIFDIKELK